MFQNTLNFLLSSPLFWPAALSAFFIWLWFTADTFSVPSPNERWRRDEAFREKTRELEIDFKDKPQALRTRTVILACLGYAVVFSSIALMIVIGVKLALLAMHLPPPLSLAGLAALIPIGFAFKLGRALLRSGGGDYGVRLTQKDALPLFALLQDICRKARGPDFERVFISPDMNAMVSRHTGPLGFFGFGPVTLTLGLPLMQALTRDQIAAVVGHEYGHVAAKDNAFGQWIYRIRNSWTDLGRRLKGDPLWYTLRLNRFYDWFIGVFNPYSFTLSRQCEFEADAFAARLVGASHIAGALVSMQLQDTRLHREFWPELWKRAEDKPLPLGTPYQKLAVFFRTPFEAQEDLKTIAARKTNHESTHPALSDRVTALKQTLTPPAPITENAATALLGAPLEFVLTGMFDKSWLSHSRRDWQRKHRKYQAALAQFQALQSTKLEHMQRDDLTRLVDAAYQLQQYDTISAACAEILKREPDNMSAKVHMLGFRLTAGNDPSALIKLDDLAREHPDQSAAACTYAVKYLTRQHRLTEAAVYQFRLDEWKYQNQAAEEERKAIFPNDVLLPHNLKAEYVEKLARYFKQHPIVGAAWMARKDVGYMKDRPLYIVGLKPNIWRFKSGKQNLQDMRRVTVPPEFGPYFRFFWLGSVPGLKRRLKKIKGSRVY